jgi:hypothetical protein
LCRDARAALGSAGLALRFHVALSGRVVVAYLMDSFVGTLLPQYDDLASSISTPIQLGEWAFMVGLLMMGVKPRRTAVSNPSC